MPDVQDAIRSSAGEYRRVRAQIIVLIGVLLAFIWGSLAFFVERSYENSVATARRSTSNLAQAFEENVLRTLENADEALQFMRGHYQRELDAFDPKRALDRAVSVRPLALQLAIIDSRGLALKSSVGPVTESVDLSDREHIKVHMSERPDTLFISKPVLGRLSNQWSIQLTRRLSKPDGSFGGVIVLSLDPFALSAFYKRIDVGPHGIISLIGLDGFVRARSQMDETIAVTPLAGSPLFQAIDGNPVGTFVGRSRLDGVERISAYRSLANYPMVVVVGMATDDVLAAFRRHAWSALAIGTMATLLLAWFTRLLLSRFSSNSRHLLKLTEDLSRETARAEAANRAKSEFLANMSHEIRTPMNAILGVTYLVKRTELGDRQREYLRRIEVAAKSLLAIINDILDVSKIEAGKMVLERTEFCLDRVLEDATAIVLQKARAKGLDVYIRQVGSIPSPLTGDSMRLGQILTNLADNAVKFTERGEVVISVAVRPEGREGRAGITLAFSVRDTGRGMSPAELERVFTSYAQADSSTTRKFGGTGLGLTISRRLVEMMGGRLTAASEPGVGTTFSFDLSFGAADAAAYSNSGQTSGLAGRSALVVSGNRVSSAVIEGMLRELPVSVEIADSVAAPAKPFDIFILDWPLPAGSAIALCREAASRARAPAILACAYDAELPAELSAEFPRLEMLPKPVTRSSLLGGLARALDSAAARGPDAAGEDPAGRLSPVAGARVLVVEDNRVNQELAFEILTSWGLAVSVAGDGRSAVEAVGRQPFNLVLMDVQMPGVDGYEATRLIRATGANLPIIAMTAHALSTDRERCLASGMNGHVSKPIIVDELVEALLRWLPHRVEPRRRLSASSAPPTPGSRFAPLAPVLDIAAALRNVSGDPQLLDRLLRDIVADHGDLVDQLWTAADEERWESVQHLAHTVVGLADTIGAGALAESARTLDVGLQRGSPDGRDKARVERFAAQASRVLAALAAWSAAGGTPEGEPPAEAEALASVRSRPG